MIKGNSLLSIIILFLLIVPAFSKGNSREDSLNKNESQGFWENQGQFQNEFGKPRPDVKFIWLDDKYKIILKEKGFSYELFSIQKPNSIQNRYKAKYKFHRIDIEFINSQLPTIFKEGPSENFNNYYQGRKSPVLMVRNYSKIMYKNLYPYIDLVFSIIDGKPKYDFILNPGSDITDIKLKYSGADKTTLLNNEIIIKTSLGNIIENIPVSFQHNGKTKEVINVKYILSKNILGFECPHYDKNKILIIDPVPVLLWRKTYPVTPQSNAVDTDSYNNIIITGVTWNTSIIATTGAYQNSHNGGSADAFIIKCNSNGVKLWGTFYGGNAEDLGLDIAIDNTDNIVISGETSSTDLNVPGAVLSLKQRSSFESKSQLLGSF